MYICIYTYIYIHVCAHTHIQIHHAAAVDTARLTAALELQHAISDLSKTAVHKMWDSNVELASRIAADEEVCVCMYVCVNICVCI